MATIALGAICTASTDCKTSGCCNTAYPLATSTSGATTLKFCFAAGTAAKGLQSITAIGATTTTTAQINTFFTTTPACAAAGPCSGFNAGVACPAAKAGASTLVASAAAVATAVYMM